MGGMPFTDIQDLFDMFFGGGFAGRSTRVTRSRVRRGEDLRVAMSLAFPEAVFGITRQVEIDRLSTCGRCGGVGAEPGTTPITCRTCHGTGEVQSVRRSIFGTVMTASPCRTCGGTGEEIPDRCEACYGHGRVQAPSTVTIEVPAGVDDGMDLRVGGQGHAGVAGGPPGDLFVALSVEPSLAFERRGQDLHAVLDVSITQAALGADITIETLDGPETIRVDPGTESGRILRVKGRGVPNLHRRGRGDLFVTAHIVAPRDPSDEERRLLERLAQIRGEADGPARGELRRPEFG
jgi:molecular chaperone DnaJ